MPLRVLFATKFPYLPQFFVGGAMKSMHALCSMIQKRKVEPAVLCQLSNNGWIGWSARIRRKLRLVGQIADRDRYPGYPVYRAWTPASSIEHVAKLFRPDVIVALQPFPLDWAEKLGIPVLVSFVDVEFERQRFKVPNNSLIGALANSNFTAQKVKSAFGLSAEVIRPIIFKENYLTRTTRTRVVYVNPSVDKGIDIALRVAESRPDVAFDFIEGWGALFEQIRPYKEVANRLPNIRWMQPVTDMRSVYKDARLIFVPSKWEEAWGRIVIEAQVSGIPALASQIGGLPEAVGRAGTLISPTADISEWTHALSKMWDDRVFYDQLVTLAVAESNRPEIQPEQIADHLLAALHRHAGRSCA